MATRHSKKERQAYDAFGHIGAVKASPTATRMDKIRALARLGYNLGSKTNSDRVNARFEEVFDMVLDMVSKDDARKNARNKRKCLRQRGSR